MDQNGYFFDGGWMIPFRDYTFDHEFLEITSELRNFLSTDGMILGPLQWRSSLSEDEDEDGADAGGIFELEDTLQYPEYLFPELHRNLKAGIERLGGACMVKVGPSSPKDAVWITIENSLRCANPEEIYQLLKASDRVGLSIKTSESLIIRRWQSLDLSMEFRCFGKNASLIAICQRDDTVFYEHLLLEKGSLARRITAFIEAVVLPRSPVSDFVVDLYLDPTHRPIIVDFGPWCPSHTSPILFEWDELEKLATRESSRLVFRLIESDNECRLGRLKQNCVPIDLMDSTPTNLSDWESEISRRQNQEVSE